MSIIKNKVPKHVAIIMDGNGRWAKKNGFKRSMGHQSGVEPIRKCLSCAKDLGIELLSLYAFSTENWKRPRLEVEFLMRLLSKSLEKELPNFHKNNIKVISIGAYQMFPKRVIKALEKCIEQTKNNDGITLNLALNYGGRQEILRSVHKILRQLSSEKLNLEAIDENVISKNLDTGNLLDLDLLIRTSGERRISNFMLWQAAYTELYFTDVLWPDFYEEDFLKAIENFQNRKRRFGATHEE